jgi:hypothetical protein
MGEGWLIPALDVEKNEKYDGPFTAARYSEQCRGIAAAFAARWGGCLIYTNPADWHALGSPMWLRDYRLWLAQWGTEQPTPPLGLNWTIWQHRVAPLPGVYGRDIDQNRCRSPMPLIRPLSAVDDWDEEDDTKVTRSALTASADELRQTLARIELPRRREAETAARDRLVSESDEET